ncbi:MAG: hypothetical protein ACFFC7_06440 [Candidatus Hermodarchaeota archaeon]
MPEASTQISSHQQWMIDPQLRKYEIRIIEMFEEIVETKGRNKSLGQITAYFFMYQKLTQNQIQQLTGLSKGTISPILQFLLNVEFLYKEKIPGKRENLYIASSNIFQYAIDFITQLRSSFSQSVAFLTNIANRIKASNIPSSKKFLYERVERMLQLFSDFVQAIDIVIDGIIKKKIVEDRLIEQTSALNLARSSNIEDIERGIVDFFSKSPLFFFSKASFSKILGLLFIHKKLSQKQLKELTGFSVGAISQDLKTLEAFGIIIRQQVSYSKSIRYTYMMAPVSATLVKLIVKLVKTRLRWKPILEEMKKELEDNYVELGILNGYNAIFTIISILYRYMPIYEDLLNQITSLK